MAGPGRIHIGLMLALAIAVTAGCTNRRDEAFGFLAQVSGGGVLVDLSTRRTTMDLCCIDGAAFPPPQILNVTPIEAPGITDHGMSLANTPSSLMFEIEVSGDTAFRPAQANRAYALPARIRVKAVGCPTASARFTIVVAAIDANDPLVVPTSEVEITVRFIHNCPVAALDPRAAMDGAGNGVVVWTENGTIGAECYRAQDGFQGAQAISRDGRPSRAPEVAMGGNGNAVAVWVERDDQTEHVMAGVYDAQAGSWAAPTTLMTAATDPGPPQIALDRNGDGVAIWRAGVNIFARRYEAATGWGQSSAGAPFSAGLAVDAARRRPRLALNEDGTFALVIYEAQQEVGEGDERTRIYGHLWTPGGGFEEGQWLDIDAGDDRTNAQDAEIRIRDGVAMAVWEQQGLGNADCIAVNMFAGGIWGGPSCVSEAEPALRPRVALGPDRAGVVVYETEVGAFAVPFDDRGFGLGRTQIGQDVLQFLNVSMEHRDAGGTFVLFGDPAGSYEAQVSASEAGGWRAPRAITGVLHDLRSDFPSDLASDATGTFLGCWEENGALQRRVWLAPAANLTLTPAQPAANVDVSFDASTSQARTPGAVLERFYFDPTATKGLTDRGTETSYTASYPRPGVFEATLRVVDSWGLSGITTREVNVGAPGMVQLVIEIKGNGSGKVETEQPDTECTTMCTIDVPSGTQVSMWGTPDAGSVFDRWEGADISDGNYALINMNSNRTITAHFMPE